MKDQKGQALVELAIALPLVLVLLFGMADFGRLIYLKSSLINAARAGARVAAVITPSPVSDEQAVSLQGSGVNQAIARSLANGVSSSDSITYQLTVYDKDDGNPKTAAAALGDQVKVTLSWPDPPMWTPLSSLLALLSESSGPSGVITIRGSASMRRE